MRVKDVKGGDESLASHRREIEDSPNRHDFWRSSYATMLSDWRAEDIRDFFADRPLTIGGKVYSGADLQNLFWNANGTISTIWNYESVNALEPFMIERGYDPFLFMRKMLHRNNRATYMPGKVILGWFYPLIEKLDRGRFCVRAACPIDLAESAVEAGDG